MRPRLAGLSAAFGGFIHSVRFRLTIWFMLVLAVVLLVFSAFVYYVEAKSVSNQAMAQLDGRTHEMQDLFRRAILHDLEEHNSLNLRDIIPGGMPALEDREVLVVVDPQGGVSGSLGPLDSAQAGQVARLAGGDNQGRFFEGGLSSGQGNDPVPYLFEVSPLGVENHLAGWVILGQPADPTGLLPRLLWTLVFACLVTLLVALAGSFWLADRALWPVKAITRTARDISESDLSRRLNIHTRDELGELASTFDRMLDRLQAAFNRQRQFTADASHELRTPLTIIGLETGRALTGRRSAEDYHRTLQVIQSENEFMTRLVGELLTLARMDAGQVNLKCEALDLSDVALEVVERYASLAARKDIQLLAGDLPEVTMQGDRQYLVQMIGNLVDNAIKYSPPGPGQWVRVETGQSGNGAVVPGAGGSAAASGAAAPGAAASGAADGQRGAAWVRVSDNGPGIPADHLAHLFDRFYRVDSARSHNPEEDGGSQEIPGSGLGLSIVQWIAEMHQGEVRVEAREGQGAIFEVRFKR